MPDINKEETSTHFNSYEIAGVVKSKSGETGYRIIGLWGDYGKGQGNRIGPFFPENKLQDCEKLVDEITAKYGLPAAIETIINHFQ